MQSGTTRKQHNRHPQNTGSSLPAAESQREDQKSNIPGTNRVRYYQSQASNHPLHAPVGLEIPFCTAVPTCLRVRENVTASVYKAQTGGGKYLDKETGVKIPALGNLDFIREICRDE